MSFTFIPNDVIKYLIYPQLSPISQFCFRLTCRKYSTLPIPGKRQKLSSLIPSVRYYRDPRRDPRPLKEQMEELTAKPALITTEAYPYPELLNYIKHYYNHNFSMYNAIKTGDIYTLNLAHRFNCTYPPPKVPYPLERGSHSSITGTRVLERELTLDYSDILMAARHNHFHVLQWYYSVKPCRFNPLVSAEAVMHNNVAALRWLLLIGTCYPLNATLLAVLHNSVECMELLVNVGAEIYFECSCIAIRNNNLKMLQLIHKHNKLANLKY
jgi:hypothetical protein